MKKLSYYSGPSATEQEWQRRFWDRVDIREDGCWVWTGSRRGHPTKYGTVMKDGVSWAVHRLVYTTLKGAIPEGLEICHNCNTSLCCNPDHLRADTHASNVRDSWLAGRKPLAGEQHGMSKLNNDAVVVIRLLDGLGWSQRRIARAFSVQPFTIARVLNGSGWREIEQVNIR